MESQQLVFHPISPQQLGYRKCQFSLTLAFWLASSELLPVSALLNHMVIRATRALLRDREADHEVDNQPDK
jgi:TfoX/Sxy family transcriptional regulator of competence genes